MNTQQDQEREALIERLREQLPKVGERETVWCQVRGDDLRAVVEALAQQAEPPELSPELAQKPLEQQAEPVRVPVGFALVPVEPTAGNNGREASR